jgi:hypothetical protein
MLNLRFWRNSGAIVIQLRLGLFFFFFFSFFKAWFKSLALDRTQSYSNCTTAVRLQSDYTEVTQAAILPRNEFAEEWGTAL